MILQNLLEDKRYEWQKATQEQILNGLLCKAHKYKAIGQRNDKLIMVFGKSHAGKTTFILSLMGVAENKLSELNLILRAGIPEGKSSTSTAIVYQKSDDDCFGVCEHSISELSEYEILKCTKEEFVRRIQETRLAVENRKRNNELVLYLYIPCSYFENGDLALQQINILDVPGYETTNSEERYHTEAILNKYMTVSALNIVVRSIYDINDLRYFSAPNRDDYTKLISGKYIVVTTRSYSQESIFKYFLKQPKERKNTFEEMLSEECKIQFERVFGSQIPAYFPVDIGESFSELINTKLTNQNDREYLIAYRKKVFDGIFQCIQSKQSNTLISWVKEVIEDEEYYGGVEAAVIDELISDVSEKRNNAISQLEQNMTNVTEIIERLCDKQKSYLFPEIEGWIDCKVNSCKEEHFTEDFRWKNPNGLNDVSDIFAQLFSDMIAEQVAELSIEHEVVSEKMKKKWQDVCEDVELELRNNLDEVMNAHKILQVLNPSNKEKIELGRKALHEIVPVIIRMFHEQVLEKYDEEVSQKTKKYNQLKILLEANRRKVDELNSSLNKQLREKAQLEEKKKAVEQRVKKDKAILREYRKIAYENFSRQQKEVMELINRSVSKEEKAEYLILLCLIDKDYRKIAME